MTLIERLEALAKRREYEGLYTDASIVRRAADRITRLELEISKLVARIRALDDAQPKG